MAAEKKAAGSNVAVLVRVPRGLLSRVDSVAKRQARTRTYLVVAALQAQYGGKAARS